MLSGFRTIRSGLLLAGMFALAENPAKATTIASDDFLTTGTAGFYSATSVNGQTAINGTTGYYTGSTTGTQTAGWASGTGAFVAETTPVLSNPNVVNPPTSNDGSLTIVGNSNTRSQYRDLASTSPIGSSDYYFSLLLSESVSSYTGLTYAGVGQAHIAGAFTPASITGFGIGFSNGALSLFYSTGGLNLISESLLSSPAANQTYMVELHLAITSSSTATLTPFVYSGSTLVNSPVAQAVSASESTTTDMGAFQAQVSSDFTSGTLPAKVVFDEFRFGTAENDVIAVPEPSVAGLLVLGVAGLLGYRRKDRHAKAC